MAAARVRLNKPFGVAAMSLLLFATSAADTAKQTDGIDQEQVRAEVMPLFNAMQAAANIHDVDAHLAYFTHDPDLLFVANGVVIHGWDNLHAQQIKWWPAGKIPPTDQAHQPYRLTGAPTFQFFGPELVMLTFVLDARRVYPDKVMRRPLAISQLWEKQKEGWKIVYAHESFGVERPER